jgi:hypothetical protein
LMAGAGVRLVGAVATTASAGLLGLLLDRCAVLRPRAGAIAGAACLFANLLVGRVTFAVGTAVALSSLVAMTSAHKVRWLVLVIGPVVTAAASPLAALFVALAGLAVLLRRPGCRAAVVLSVSGIVALAGSAWIGQEGQMPAPVDRELAGVLVCCIVVLVSASSVVRVGAVLTAGGLVLSLLIDTPVGMNALRLPAVFAAPVLLATSTRRLIVAVPAAALAVALVPPLTADDVSAIGEASNSRSYYVDLLAELDSVPLTGRVEIPPTLQRWEAVYVAASVPLARGWETQLDTGYNPLFFDAAPLDATTYRSWLHDNAVQYVALPDAALAEAGRDEATLIKAGLPYLHRVWTDAHWSLYAVARPTSTVTGAELVVQDATAVTFRAATPGPVTVRVRWSRWLTLTGPAGCLRDDATWTGIDVRQAGTYRLSSAVLPGDHRPLCGASESGGPSKIWPSVHLP